MKYLYIPGPDINDGKPWQSERGPAPGHAEQIIDGDLEVFRDGFEQLVPIDRNDLDSWNLVEGEDAA